MPRRPFLRPPGSLLLALLLVAVPRAAQAQGAIGGVYIDADGMLRELSTLTDDQRIELLRQPASQAAPPRDVAARSPLRMVSLRRLEDACRRHHAAGQPLPADVRHVAGLTGIRYVLFDPETEDVLLGGPAEGWTALETGDIVGDASGRPALQLDDLIAALRYAFAEQADGFIGCSIEPTPEGLQAHARFLGRLGGRMDRSRAAEILAGMEQAMGPQAVKVFGVDPKSRFALKLVAADYRLKRIALSHDPSPVPELTSYLDLVAAKLRHPAAQPQHRWWFVAEYDAIYHTPDGLAYELDGQGVKVATARTLSDEESNPKPSPLAEQFADDFTEHFEAVAARQPVFAELQNLIALSVAAELVARQHDAATAPSGQRHWFPDHFLDKAACPVEELAAPQHVPSLANVRIVGGRHWVITISGGVEIAPGEVVEAALQPVPHGRIAASPGVPDQSRWWWDAPL